MLDQIETEDYTDSDSEGLSVVERMMKNINPKIKSIRLNEQERSKDLINRPRDTGGGGSSYLELVNTIRPKIRWLAGIMKEKKEGKLVKESHPGLPETNKLTDTESSDSEFGVQAFAIERERMAVDRRLDEIILTHPTDVIGVYLYIHKADEGNVDALRSGICYTMNGEPLVNCEPIKRYRGQKRVRSRLKSVDGKVFTVRCDVERSVANTADNLIFPLDESITSMSGAVKGDQIWPLTWQGLHALGTGRDYFPSIGCIGGAKASINLGGPFRYPPPSELKFVISNPDEKDPIIKWETYDIGHTVKPAACMTPSPDELNFRGTTDGDPVIFSYFMSEKPS